jgi:hypothetical protein
MHCDISSPDTTEYLAARDIYSITDIADAKMSAVLFSSSYRAMFTLTATGSTTRDDSGKIASTLSLKCWMDSTTSLEVEHPGASMVMR